MTVNHKVARFFLLALLLHTPLVQAGGALNKVRSPEKIWTINRPTVDLHRVRISQQLVRNKYERVGIFLASSAVVVALGAWSFGAFSRKDAALTMPQTTAQSLDSNVKQSRAEMRALVNRVWALEKALKRCGVNADAQHQAPEKKSFANKCVTFGKNVLHSTANNFAVLLLMGGLPGPINKMFGFWGRKLEALGARVYHDSDFHWFVTQQTHAVQYFDNLEKSANALALAHDEEERAHYKKAMLWSGSMLTKQIARVIAFMEYQADNLKVLHAGCGYQMQVSAKYVFRHVEKFAQELQVMLDNPTTHVGIPAYIKSFREKIRSEQDTFCINEQAALYNISDETESL